MIRLPVSGALFELRAPAGADDNLLLELGDGEPGAAVAVLRGLAAPVAGGPAVDDLTLTDIQTLLLRLQQQMFGRTIEAAATCLDVSCGAAISVSFDLDDYLDHHAPGNPKGAVPDPRPGWWRLDKHDAAYRLPTASDIEAARHALDGETALRRRCLDPFDMPAAKRRRAERAMARQAPDLSGPLRTKCPDCGAESDVQFDVEHFVLSNLRAHAAFVYEDTHLLALHYHWPEAMILSMPRARRIRYAEMLRGAA